MFFYIKVKHTNQMQGRKKNVKLSAKQKEKKIFKQLKLIINNPRRTETERKKMLREVI